MSDQADELRQLISDCHSLPGSLDAAKAVTLVVGGNHGEGSTHIASELAHCLTRLGARSVLFGGSSRRTASRPSAEAAPQTPPSALPQGRAAIQDILAERGSEPYLGDYANSRDQRIDTSPGAHRRLNDGFERLSRRYDHIVIDGATMPTGLLRRVFVIARNVLMVTTPDDVTVLDTYTTLKDFGTAATDGLPPTGGQVWLLINRAGSSAIARDVHTRLARAAQHFLNLEVHLAGCLLEGQLREQLGANTGPNGDCDAAGGWSLIPLAEKLLQRSTHMEKQLIG